MNLELEVSIAQELSPLLRVGGKPADFRVRVAMQSNLEPIGRIHLVVSQALEPRLFFLGQGRSRTVLEDLVLFLPFQERRF